MSVPPSHTRSSGTSAELVGVVGVAGVAVGMVLVGRMHRRTMLLTGLTGTTTSLLVLAAMVVFVAVEQCFVSTVTWLLLSELFPLKIRGFAMGIAVFVLWMVNFGISQLFPIVNRAVGPTWTFLIFVGLASARSASWPGGSPRPRNTAWRTWRPDSATASPSSPSQPPEQGGDHRQAEPVQAATTAPLAAPPVRQHVGGFVGLVAR